MCSHTAVINQVFVLFGSQAELQRSLQAIETSSAAAQEALSEKEMELRELKSQKAAEQGMISREDHEALRLSLQAEINAVTARFNDLTRKHEKTCTEVCVCVCGSEGSSSLLISNPFNSIHHHIQLLCLPQSQPCSMKAFFQPLNYSDVLSSLVSPSLCFISLHSYLVKSCYTAVSS